MTDKAQAKPTAYFITFNTYGSWLHGDSRGSVLRRPFRGRKGIINSHPGLHLYQRDNLPQKPVTLSEEQRVVVLEAIVEECSFRQWKLHAQTIREQHCHAAVEGDCTPEKIMKNLKARATRKLREKGLFQANQKVWARHGSTRYLWTVDDLKKACDYIKSHGSAE